MATKKDLVEAYSFSRRRLVTAFVSGAPGGREVEPSRPGRMIVGGVALGVLLVAAAGVIRLIAPADSFDPSQAGLVTDKDTGAAYVILAPDPGEDTPELRQVANITSAMLLLGYDNVEPQPVSHDTIVAARRGEPIGILQAPSTPPDTDLLLPTGWTACTGADDAGAPLGIQVTMSERPQVQETPDAGYVVRQGGATYLVAETTLAGEGTLPPRAYLYALDDGPGLDGLLSSVARTTGGAAVPVPRDWLTLFPQGAPLTLASFGLTRRDLGAAPADRSDLPRSVVVGDVLQVANATGAATSLLVRRTDLLELTPFAAEVYRNIDRPAASRDREPVPLNAAPRLAVTQVAGSAAFSWPTEPTEAAPSSEPCAVLDTAAGRRPGVRVGTPESSTAPSSAEGVAAGESEVDVDYGHGAVVVSGDWDDVGAAQPVLIDDAGEWYSLDDESRTLLGYEDLPQVVVPDTWIDLFEQDVPLTLDAALCPPTSETRRGPC